MRSGRRETATRSLKLKTLNCLAIPGVNVRSTKRVAECDWEEHGTNCELLSALIPH